MARASSPIMFASLLGWALCLAGGAQAQVQAQTADPNAAIEPEITVTGAREEPPVRPPTPTTGSRIARPDQGPLFQSVATNTGVAGLTPGSGMDPFAGMTRSVTETVCRSDDARLSAAASCRLAPVQALVAAGAYDEARIAIERFIASETITDEERYLAAGIWYRIGELAGDSGDRENALAAMIGTAAMPAAERLSALRSLVALALRRDDRPGAMRLLERLVPIAPGDARSRASLAGLYSEAGRNAEALVLIREAIVIARNGGQAVPGDWLAFAATARPDG